MMNKKLLTLAVASAMAVPAIASAEAVLYGKLNVSVDYISVDKNATFFRPGQEGLRPQFYFDEFVAGRGDYDSQATGRQLGQTYLTNDQRLNLNPLGWNPYDPTRPGFNNYARAGGNVNAAGVGIATAPPAYLYNNGEPLGNSSVGARTQSVLNGMASASYYGAAIQYLRSQLPRNVQGWGSEPFSAVNNNPLLNATLNNGQNGVAVGALGYSIPGSSIQGNAQQAGWQALATQYGYSNQAGASASNVAVQATQYANEAYNAAYASAIARGAAATTAVQEGNAAGNAAYNAYAGNAWSAFQNNYKAAENVAFAAEGANVGAANLTNYFAGQQARLNNDLAVGNVTGTFYLAQQQRLHALERIAYSAAAVASYKPGQAYHGWGMTTMNNAARGPASRVGVKGSEDLGNGIKAIYQVELAIDIDNQNRDSSLVNGNRGTVSTVGRYGNWNKVSGYNSGIAMRNTFVGLSSPWGTVLMGRHDTPLKLSTAKLDLFADGIANFNTTVGFQDLRADNAVAYISPDGGAITPWLTGLQFMGAVVPAGGATGLGSVDGQNNGIASAYSLALIYKNGPFYASAAYENLGKNNWNGQNINYQVSFNQNAKSDSKLRFGLGLLDWNGFSLTGVYEKRNNILGAPTKASGDYLTFQASYTYGANVFKAMWGKTSLGSCADPNAIGFRYTCDVSTFGQYFADTGFYNQKGKSTWALGYDYNFSKRTQGYLVYTSLKDSNPNANWSAFSVGMSHSF
jgi:predicted porin